MFFIILKKYRVYRYKSSIRTFKRNLMDLKRARDKEGSLLLARTDIMLDIAGCYIMRNVSIFCTKWCGIGNPIQFTSLDTRLTI